MKERMERLREMDAEIQKLRHIAAILHWDQETCMPSGAVEERSEQIALAEGLVYDRLTAGEVGELLAALGVDAEHPEGTAGAEAMGEVDRAFLRELGREHRRKTRLPRRLVTEMARQTSIGQKIWAEARRRADFAAFAPRLETILSLVIETAECLGYQEHRYDALLDEYEPWMKAAEVERIFASFRGPLTELVQRIVASGRSVDAGFLHREFPVDRQRRFSERVLRAIGYELERGRLDESAHPFTTTLGRSDVRLTTRYNPRNFGSGIFGTVHEAGHGLYELGIASGLRDTLLADGASLGIHESQSRMWENLIGRSLPFWRHFYPAARELFPEALGDVELDRFYHGINAVSPSLIRVEADEVTYNLHIILRFTLEKALVAGELRVADLPGAWNEESDRLLGIVPPDDAQGVLQDIHWSMGGMGYFPTYALGNLYAAQLFEAMGRDLPELSEGLAHGDFASPLAWLREKVHVHGRVYSAKDLCRKATGAPLDPSHSLRYLEGKFAAIYGV